MTCQLCFGLSHAVDGEVCDGCGLKSDGTHQDSMSKYFLGGMLLLRCHCGEVFRQTVHHQVHCSSKCHNRAKVIARHEREGREP